MDAGLEGVSGKVEATERGAGDATTPLGLAGEAGSGTIARLSQADADPGRAALLPAAGKGAATGDSGAALV